MTVYVISDVTIRDRQAFEAYRTRAAASIAAHGGRYLIRGGDVETLEGDLLPGPLIVVVIAIIHRYLRGPPALFMRRRLVLS